MGQLHQVLAVEKETEANAARVLNRIGQLFKNAAQYFMGQTQSVEFIDETRAANENTSDTNEVAKTVDGAVRELIEDFAPVLDMVLQRDSANQDARATLEVGLTLFTNLPATFLLNLAKRLEAVRSVVAQAPTLDPSIQWVDSDLGEGVWKTKDEKITHRGEKRPDSIITAPATDRHPAQVNVFTRDVVVAKVRTTRYSGAWTGQRKNEVMRRIDDMIKKVKAAREVANQVEVPNVKIGQTLLEYLFQE